MAKPKGFVKRKDEMRQMLSKGMSYGEIAAEIGCSRTMVTYCLKEHVTSRAAARDVVYLPVQDWMRREGVTFADIARMSGYSPTTVHQHLCGIYQPNKDIIDTVLLMSKKSYEEMFQ